MRDHSVSCCNRARTPFCNNGLFLREKKKTGFDAQPRINTRSILDIIVIITLCRYGLIKAGRAQFVLAVIRRRNNLNGRDSQDQSSNVVNGKAIRRNVTLRVS